MGSTSCTVFGDQQNKIILVPRAISYKSRKHVSTMIRCSCLRLGNDAVAHAAQPILQIEAGTDEDNCEPVL
jgi:hypothetical protein